MATDLDIREIRGNVPPYVAARDVLRDGKADFAHNIQLESAALVDLVQRGEAGRLGTSWSH